MSALTRNDRKIIEFVEKHGSVSIEDVYREGFSQRAVQDAYKRGLLRYFAKTGQLKKRRRP